MGKLDDLRALRERKVEGTSGGGASIVGRHVGGSGSVGGTSTLSAVSKVVGGGVTGGGKFDRVRYQREYMRKRRGTRRPRVG